MKSFIKMQCKKHIKGVLLCSKWAWGARPQLADPSPCPDSPHPTVVLEALVPLRKSFENQ